MPQINQLSDVLYSQLFWLALTLAVIYFGIGKAMLPKIMSTMEARDSQITQDLAAAEAARREADSTEEAYRVRMDASRLDAVRLAADAKAASARATAARVAEADVGIDAVTNESERRLAAARASALGEIEGVAAGAAQELVAKLSGVSVGRSEATRAVQAAMRGARG